MTVLFFSILLFCFNVHFLCFFKWITPSITSNILTNAQKILLLKECQFKFSMFTLLYQATRDGFDPNEFHKRCDHIQSTICIIQTTEGYVFGGYAKSPWLSIGSYFYDDEAFLFSLDNTIGTSFKCSVKRPNRALVCMKSKGPSFGDFYVENTCGTMRKLSAFSLPDIFKNYNEKIFCGARKFEIEEIEVFFVN